MSSHQSGNHHPAGWRCLLRKDQPQPTIRGFTQATATCSPISHLPQPSNARHFPPVDPSPFGD